jgi:RNA polymerase sigma-B factor
MDQAPYHGSLRGPAPGAGAIVPDTEELFARLRSGHDAHAREQLVERFMPLARKLAARYSNPYEPFDDLVQVASVGLLGAIDRFDPTRAVAFSSFAIPTILGELKRYFRSTGWSAHVPRRAQEMALRIDRGSRQLSADTGRSPTVAELAQYLELSTEDVLLGLDAGRAHYSVSLDAPAVGHGDDSEPETLGSSLGTDDERFALVDTRTSIAAALRCLPYIEREALRLRLTDDMKQTEIAERLGCSQMQVSRLLRRAASRVRVMTELQIGEAPGTGTSPTSEPSELGESEIASGAPVAGP